MEDPPKEKPKEEQAPPPQPPPPNAPQDVQQPHHEVMPQAIHQQGHYGSFGMEPQWGTTMSHHHQHHHHGGAQYLGHAPIQPGAMEGALLSTGLAGLTLGESVDPLEAVLGPFPCVRLRGLPYEASLEDVLVFFQGLVVLDVVVVGGSGGDGTGEAFVIFANPMDFQMALQRDKQNMGRQYVEVFQGKRDDYYAAIAAQYWSNQENRGRENKGDSIVRDESTPFSGWGAGGAIMPPPMQTSRAPGPQRSAGDMIPPGAGAMPRTKGVHSAPPQAARAGPASASGRPTTRGGGIRDGEHTGYLRMRGLPFSASKKEIIEFFKGHNPIENSICLTCRSDGRATGEGYVAFNTPDEAKKAMGLHRSTMGSRYIELFISNKEEHARALARSNNR